MARSSIGNDIEVTGSPAPSQSNTINLTDNDPDSPAPSTPGTSESQEATTSKKRKTSERSLTSDVWSHFTAKFWPDVITAPKRSPEKAHRERTTSVPTGNQVWVFSQERSREKLARMIIAHEYAFSIVEHPGFIDFMATTQPLFVMPGRQTVRNDCLKLFNHTKAVEMAKMSKALKISLTTDLWTASDMTGYMVVTGHYIDAKWQLVKVIMSFRPLPPPHTGPAIADRLSQVMIEWKVVDKVCFVTLDNASSNNLAMTRVQRFINDRQHGPDLATSSHFHVRCLAHVINLVVKDGLKEVGIAVQRLRTAVGYIYGSSSRMDAFDKALSELKMDVTMKHPSKDVPTRWNSIFAMIESSLPCKLAFQQLEIEDSSIEDWPNERNWEDLETIVKFFLLSSPATVALSGTQYPTIIHAYRAMKGIEKLLNDCAKRAKGINPPHLIKMISPMKLKFDKYWVPMKEFLAIGMILDPQYKMRYLRYSLEQSLTPGAVDTFCGKVRSELLAMWQLYIPARTSPTPTLQAASTSKPKGVDEEMLAFQRHMAGTMGATQTNAPGAELDLYLEERNVMFVPDDNEHFDITGWWKANATRYPSLSELARILLMVPMTSVASESAFSTGGRVLDDHRMRLNNNTVEALLCTQDWIKPKGHVPKDTKDDS
ncbi:hypothetical protein MJO28_010837 [Puccinia striiformis f. sp. tritici]|uniref:Uncharacterized protein n=1 Tax=Puccinia striiformis f. sp. tritici TaxID=168172 RepID=A0ACC0E616_9BASI|nr:hypothetical protein MJO28_010837 [Puccinia striiformis f. sp. tritici]